MIGESRTNFFGIDMKTYKLEIKNRHTEGPNNALWLYYGGYNRIAVYEDLSIHESDWLEVIDGIPCIAREMEFTVMRFYPYAVFYQINDKSWLDAIKIVKGL